MKTIPMYVESENGHDTFQVEQNKIQSAVEEQLNNDRWITTEKTNGSTEILTKNDIPNENKENKPKDDWKNCFSTGKELSTSQSQSRSTNSVTNSTTKKEWVKKFECVKSITSVNKAKGG